MKSIKTFASILAASLAVGCASTNFIEYRGPDLVQGTGGTVRTVDGIEFWENGNPNRKVKILGVIDDKRADGLFSKSSRDSALAKTAKSKGGDAVVLMDSNRQAEGFSGRGTVYSPQRGPNRGSTASFKHGGSVVYSVSTKVMVVKYTD